jgi:hypothetical protein
VANSSAAAKVRQKGEGTCRNCYRMSIVADQGFRAECQRKIGPIQFISIKYRKLISTFNAMSSKKNTDGGESELMSPETPVLELLLSLVGDEAF